MTATMHDATPPLSLADAACRWVLDPRIFDATSGPASATALLWCRGCPIAGTCLAIGVSARGDGVWGGRVLLDGAPLP